MFYNVEIISSLNQKLIKEESQFPDTQALEAGDIEKKKRRKENVNIVVFCLLLALEQVIR